MASISLADKMTTTFSKAELLLLDELVDERDQHRERLAALETMIRAMS